VTDDELKEIVASIAVENRELVVAQKETDRQLKETDRQLKETDRQLKETDSQLKAQASEADRDRREMKRSNRELGKQIGGLANKFGSFTEGLALPSMQQILRSQFNMEVVSPSVRVKKGDEELEVDVLSYANSTLNEVYVVEVKSHLRDDGIDQLSDIVNRFRHFFPEHKDKKLYGIMAAVEMSNRLKERVLSKGFYAAKISDEVFSIDVPAQFHPKAY
jgi:hypothetical protein